MKGFNCLLGVWVFALISRVLNPRTSKQVVRQRAAGLEERSPYIVGLQLPRVFGGHSVGEALV